jgi:RNA polymerase sigma-70 factor (ECF subfamily)
MSTMQARIAVANEVETVFREDGDRLWRSLFAFAGDAEIASDAVAEAFAQALRRGAALRDVRGWVWRSAFRIAGGELQRGRAFDHRPVPDSPGAGRGADLELLDALRGLTPQQRIVLTLFYYVDCPVREISRRTGMNQLAVRAHLSRGRKRLRDLLGDDDA